MVLDIVGLPHGRRRDRIADRYHAMTLDARELDPSDDEGFERLAMDIYLLVMDVRVS